MSAPYSKPSGRRASMIVVGVVSALWAGSGICAEQAPPAPAPPDYHPSMGDLMTMAIQPRHIKLGLAGQARNWPYAIYELSELRNAFGRITRTIPQYRNVDMAPLVSAMTQAPLDAIENAIKARDLTQFTRAYATLTAVCNACHASQDHALVVIQVPKAAVAFADQNFSPAGPH